MQLVPPDGGLERIVGTSRPMQSLRAYLKKAALSDASVLITGDTGTGKELAAQSLHSLSPRRARPFVPVNCAAIPDSLIESELFGYERGAFTGATQASPGQLRLAEGGTVFLDEIGDMNLGAQAKLLRVLETRAVYPLGGRRAVPVDVRFVAATNQPLEPLLAEHRFRKDLYFRLNVLRVQMPALRNRSDDIPLLLSRFLEEFNARYARSIEGVTPELLDCLRGYDWPGNVRELRNLVEAMYVDCSEGPLSTDSLPEFFRGVLAYEQSGQGERGRILSVLAETNWNKSETASRLHWSRMTLYRKMHKYSVSGKPGPESTDH
jgi:transcriptional regulator with PAS, ATPase and Fis domain